MKKNRIPNLVLQDAVTIYRTNFEGREEQFNRKGDRNFNVLIPPHLVDSLLDYGWNVKATKPREEEDIVEHYLQVAVSFDPFPPTVFMVTNQKTMLDENTVVLLDAAYITSMDVIINASPWEVNGKSGVKAYLKKGFFNIEQDELDNKYNDIPMAKSSNAFIPDESF